VSKPGIVIRRADSDDIPAALEVASRALVWNPHDPNEAFFRWKHIDNPAGASPMWVAVDDGMVCGFRAMLRWTFADRSHTRSAVRAVDTATDPDHLCLVLHRCSVVSLFPIFR